MYARVRLLEEEARLLTGEADRLMRENARPPCPLFPDLEGEK
jgi:hypothetical protein